MQFGLPGSCEHWCPKGSNRGLSANENARALISMMARSKCSNQRPDTLMQDAHRQLGEPLATHGRTIHAGQERRFDPLPITSGLPDQRTSFNRPAGPFRADSVEKVSLEQ